MFGYNWNKHEFNHRVFYSVYINMPYLVSFKMFSNAQDAQAQIQEYKRMGAKFNSDLMMPFNCLTAYLNAAYGNGGYLCSNIKNHQLYITNLRG